MRGLRVAGMIVGGLALGVELAAVAAGLTTSWPLIAVAVVCIGAGLAS